MPTHTASSSSLKKQRRGFSVMSTEARSKIARAGGKAVAKNRKHMSDIGRLGGAMSSRARKTKQRSSAK